jgi:hypothetical protein
LNKWLLASHLLAASKKGMSAHQLHRMLGVTYKTAWFMAHRIREAMKQATPRPARLGGEGKTVEADETYHRQARDAGNVSPQRTWSSLHSSASQARSKRIVVGLVERGGQGSHLPCPARDQGTVRDVLVRNADRKSTLYTDESNLYPVTGGEFDAHRTVKHSAKEYARREGDVVVHTNTIENVFSIFKRGMVGVYQHCGEAHLAPLPCRVRFPLQSPHGAQVDRCRARRRPAAQWLRQAPDLSADW